MVLEHTTWVFRQDRALSASLDWYWGRRTRNSLKWGKNSMKSLAYYL